MVTFRRFLSICCLVLIGSSALATPEFARTYKMPCIKCHVHVPKLSPFGEEFVANGYRIPGASKNKTLPVAAWFSLQAQNRAADSSRFKTVPNRLEFISAGAASDKLSYFVEWRALSREVLADGTVRDRSGRFEDLFVIADVAPSLQLQVGQFRPLSMIDVSRRLNLSEPTVFGSGLAGVPDSDSRITGLRGFSASGRSPAIKLSGTNQGWTGALTVPFPGEFSIPMTEEARTTASFEFESKPKGAFLEVFYRRAASSFGLFGFTGDNRRSLYGLAFQHQVDKLWLEGGVARGATAGSGDWRYSLGLDWIACNGFAAGMRIDHRQIAADSAILSPYISFLKPFDEHAAKLVFEGRFQKDRTPRFAIELSWMF